MIRLMYNIDIKRKRKKKIMESKIINKKEGMKNNEYKFKYNSKKRRSLFG